ncbi:MAG: SIMPL domain-containing protein [Kofleriaceae bacterium]
MLKKTLVSVALASSLFACRDAAPQIIIQPPTEVAKPGQMTVTGSATLEVAPDCADLTMTISADGARAGIATTGAQDKQQALVAALLKLGVEAADIKLSELTLNPIYNEASWSQLRVATYRAQVTVSVTTKRFDRIGAIMDTGAQTGASSMASAFRRSDLPELKKKVRDMALAAAKDKAAQTARALGVALGRVITVSEAPNGYMWSNGYFPRANEVRAQPSSDGTPSIGGVMQPLTLEISIGFELGKTV